MQKILANLVGLASLALSLFLFALLPQVSDIPVLLWFFIYFTLVVCAFFIWGKYSNINKPSQWILVITYTLLASVGWFIYARFFSFILWGDKEPKFSEFVDITITFMLSPGLLSIAFSGWIRSLYIKYFTSRIPNDHMDIF